jgi:hypothetical protein
VDNIKTWVDRYNEDPEIQSVQHYMAEEIADLRAALAASATTEIAERAMERMDRARNILTNGNPTPNCNWGMLDTSDLRAALIKQVPTQATSDDIQELPPLPENKHAAPNWTALYTADQMRDYAHSALAKQVPAQEQDKDAQRNRVWNAVQKAVIGAFWCNRVWSAWQVGTMTEDDFVPMQQCYTAIDEITDSVIAAQLAQSADKAEGE